MKLSIVVAMAENGVIGVDNKLPWRLPADLKHFRAITMGHPVIMGRKTFESIGRALPGRRNIVVTRNSDYAAEGAEVVHSVDEALERCSGTNEAFLIGGAILYKEAISHCDRIYLTLVHVKVEGDAFFPLLDVNHWQEIERSPHLSDELNPHAYDFVIYERT
ncbi:MAG TPA: dihydrofolate reductase [Burkholderiales bacterium]|jgi:dihydrofolate reductase|nr:dihydrofolate reductase [Burkholderiales bacterium]